KRAAFEPSDDRHLGAAPRREQLREARIVEQQPDLLDHRLALLGGKRGGVVGKVAPGGLGARRAWNGGERLQQPGHEHAARQGLLALAAAAGCGRARGRCLVIGERRRDRPNWRRLGFRVAVEPGRALLRGYRRRGGEAYAGGRRRLAITPDFAVA